MSADTGTTSEKKPDADKKDTSAMPASKPVISADLFESSSDESTSEDDADERLLDLKMKMV